MRHVLYSTSSVFLAILIVIALLLSLTGFVHAQTATSSIQFLSSTTTATTSATIIAMPSPTASCFSGKNNLSVGADDNSDVVNQPVHALQQFLKEQGYMTIDPTGYFGQITLAAVKHFQEDNHITPTGFFGPITQQTAQQISCQKQWSAITVVSPAENDTLLRGSNENIIWNVAQPETFAASPVPANQASYTVTLAPLSICTPGRVCPLMAIKPYTLATNLLSHGFYRVSFAWIVGNNAENRTIPDGQYRIEVCSTDNTNCVQSEIFTIADSTSTPATNALPQNLIHY